MNTHTKGRWKDLLWQQRPLNVSLRTEIIACYIFQLNCATRIAFHFFPFHSTDYGSIFLSVQQLPQIGRKQVPCSLTLTMFFFVRINCDYESATHTDGYHFYHITAYHFI